LKNLTLLIDADITAYQATAGSEIEYEWGDDIWTLHTNLKEAKEHFDFLVNKLVEETDIHDYKLCFSDSANFRKAIYPDYKGNRKGRKPVGYNELKRWAMETHPSFSKPSLEADDCLGILATKYPGKIVIATMDKDLLTIPGMVYKVKPNGSAEMIKISDSEADYNFLLQALTGDTTDNYKGCPGIGPKRAEELFKKHGAVWKTVEDAYLKAGLTKEDALMNARMARILRACDYDFNKDEVILWTPT
jgi:DNA polymerase I